MLGFRTALIVDQGLSQGLLGVLSVPFMQALICQAMKNTSLSRRKELRIFSDGANENSISIFTISVWPKG